MHIALITKFTENLYHENLDIYGIIVHGVYLRVAITTRFDKEMNDRVILLALVLASMFVTTSPCARG